MKCSVDYLEIFTTSTDVIPIKSSLRFPKKKNCVMLLWIPHLLILRALLRARTRTEKCSVTLCSQYWERNRWSKNVVVHFRKMFSTVSRERRKVYVNVTDGSDDDDDDDWNEQIDRIFFVVLLLGLFFFSCTHLSGIGHGVSYTIKKCRKYIIFDEKI